MAFMPKEILEEEAEKYGIDLTGLTHAKKQSLVANARKEAGVEAYGTGIPKRKRVSPNKDIPEYQMKVVEKNEQELREVSPYNQDNIAARNRAEKLMRGRDPLDKLAQYNGKTILIAPEIKPNINTLAYQEDLGEELEVEVIEFDPDTVDNVSEGSQWNSKTYKVKGSTGRRVKAKSHLPRFQPMLTFRPDTDLVPVAELMGQRGYLFKHHSMPCIKSLLIESGTWEEHRAKFTNNNSTSSQAIFYIGGLLCCDISFTNYLFKEIENKAAQDVNPRR